jgi:hypothetical protein
MKTLTDKNLFSNPLSKAYRKQLGFYPKTSSETRLLFREKWTQKIIDPNDRREINE